MEDPELLTITTLENALYMSVKNDLSFILDSKLSLYEHQSTQNPNLPLRFLIYLSDIYSGLVKDKDIYGTKVIPLPTLQFIVFYNGKKTRPGHEVLKLSDAYMVKDRRISLELVVDVLNVNVEHNKELLKACRTLGDYAEYVSRTRKYAKTMAIEEAVEKAIDERIQEGILSEFLKQNRADAKYMSITKKSISGRSVKVPMRTDANRKGKIQNGNEKMQSVNGKMQNGNVFAPTMQSKEQSLKNRELTMHNKKRKAKDYEQKQLRLNCESCEKNMKILKFNTI